jgi:hypothetical protein
VRLFWNVAGFVLTGLGIAGYILPVMPGTVFLILALVCFDRGNNDILATWLRNHKWFGASLRDWESHKSLTLRVKVIICTVIGVSSGLSAWQAGSWWLKAIALGLGIAGIAYILTRPTRRPVESVTRTFKTTPGA